MIKSIQLAIILAFTAPWEIKIEQIVLILDFLQMMKNNDNIMISKWSLHSIYQRKFENMVYGKTKYNFTSPNFTSFLKVYWSFASHDLQMDLVHAWWILSFFSIFWRKSKINTICTKFISQGAVKAWIIANCIEFII